MEARRRSLQTFRTQSLAHLQQYKRELMRLEDGLRNALPMVNEANHIASLLGRSVKFEPTLVLYIPESTADEPLSPVEELLTQKRVELMVRAKLCNGLTDARREWLCEIDPFQDRVGDMRAVVRRWMLDGEPCALHTDDDPLWSPPGDQLVGAAYLYLAPAIYGVALTQWIPIVDFWGVQQGELQVQIEPMVVSKQSAAVSVVDMGAVGGDDSATGDDNSAAPAAAGTPRAATPGFPTDKPDSMLGLPVRFKLIVVQARGLIDCPNKNVHVEFTFADEAAPRVTPQVSLSLGLGPSSPRWRWRPELAHAAMHAPNPHSPVALRSGARISTPSLGRRPYCRLTSLASPRCSTCARMRSALKCGVRLMT